MDFLLEFLYLLCHIWNVKRAAYNKPYKRSHYVVDWGMRLKGRLPGVAKSLVLCMTD